MFKRVRRERNREERSRKGGIQDSVELENVDKLTNVVSGRDIFLGFGNCKV